MIRNLFIFTIVFLLYSTDAIAAGDVYRKGVVIKSEPVYRVISTPSYKERCYEVQVPAYKKSNDSNDVLLGAIVGGAIGNQFGNGDGKDAMTVLGALLGAASQSSKHNKGKHITDHYVSKIECETIRTNRISHMLDYYETVYKHDGVLYHIKTRRFFHAGEKIIVKR